MMRRKENSGKNFVARKIDWSTQRRTESKNERRIDGIDGLTRAKLWDQSCRQAVVGELWKVAASCSLHLILSIVGWVFARTAITLVLRTINYDMGIVTLRVADRVPLRVSSFNIHDANAKSLPIFCGR